MRLFSSNRLKLSYKCSPCELARRSNAAADMVLVFANNKLVHGVTSSSLRFCTDATLLEMLRQCHVLVSKGQYMPADFKF